MWSFPNDHSSGDSTPLSSTVLILPLFTDNLVLLPSVATQVLSVLQTTRSWSREFILVAVVVPAALRWQDTAPAPSAGRPSTTLHHCHAQSHTHGRQHGVCETDASSTHHFTQTQVNIVMSHNISHVIV